LRINQTDSVCAQSGLAVCYVMCEQSAICE
jgi:hypothetical protein